MSWENLFGELFLVDLGCSFAGRRSWENLVIIVGFLLLVVDWVKEGADVVIVPSNFFFLLFSRFLFFGLFFDRLLWDLVLGCFLTFVDLKHYFYICKRMLTSPIFNLLKHKLG